MTQPIDRETTLQILTDAGCPNGYLASFALHHPQWDWMQHALNAAVAHSRKDAEPSFYLSETGNLFATRGYAERAQQGQKLIPLYAHPPEADKLLQQALEALNYHTEQTRPILQTDAACRAIRTYLEGKK